MVEPTASTELRNALQQSEDPREPPSCSCGGDSARSNAIIRRTTTVTVVVLAAIAAVVSYGHMHELAVRHGETSAAAAIVPISVDGMIVAASLALLVDSRAGRRGGALPWTFVLLGIGASLAANVAVAEPTVVGRIIAAWPSVALSGAYEMLMRMIRMSARRDGRSRVDPVAIDSPQADGSQPPQDPPGARRGRSLQREAWHWALAQHATEGALPSGERVAQAFARSARWGRQVKRAGLAGQLG